MVRHSFAADLKGLDLIKELLPLYTVSSLRRSYNVQAYILIDAIIWPNDSPSQRFLRAALFHRTCAPSRNSSSGTFSITPHSAASLKYSASPFLHSASSE